MARKTTDHLEFRETNDFGSMRRLALRSGLEDGAYDDFAKALGFFRNGELVACAGLKVQNEVYSLECVAVSEELRSEGLGRRLVTALEDEARLMGATRMWALARAPVFFERIGYQRVSQEDSPGPSLKGCESCPQYLRSCKPSIVKKDLS